MAPAAGRYNDGTSARTLAVRVWIEPSGLTIEADGRVLDRWPAEAVRLVDRSGAAGAVRLASTGRDGARLTLTDPEAARRLHDALPGLRQAGGEGRTGWRLGLWALAAVAAAVFIVLVAIPRFAEQAAAVIPRAMEERLGANVADQIVWILARAEDRPVAETECRDTAGLAALAALEGRLAGALDEDRDFDVRLIDVDLPNAFALPGSHVVVTSGLVEFAGSPEALAGVLAHEFGHSVNRDPTEAVLRTAGTTVLLGLLVGDFAGGATILAIGQQVMEAGYTRDAEQAADAFAIELLRRAEIDPRPMAALFDRFAAAEGEQGEAVGFLATHPPSAERARRFRDSGGDGSDGRRAALSEEAWRALKAACG